MSKNKATTNWNCCHLRRWSTLVAFASVVTLHSSVYTPNTLGQEPTEQVLLFKSPTGSEGIWRGTLHAQGDQYQVDLAGGSKAWIRRDHVLFAGDTIEQVYDFKSKNITHWAAGDHFQLTRWCMKHGLLNHAAKHYQAVANAHRNHPRVKQLSEELKNKMLDEPRFRAYLGLSERSMATAVARKSPNPKVTSASFAGGPISASAKLQFTQRIQPILHNRCSQAACHGNSTTSQLRIQQTYAEARSRITEENLANVLPFSNAEAHQPAKLLLYAVTAHGIQKKPAIEPQEQLLIQELQSWIRSINNRVVTAGGIQTDVGNIAFAAGASSTGTDNLTQVATGHSGLRQVPTTGDTEATRGQNFSPGSAPTMAEIDALDLKLRQILGELPPASSQDAHDPDEFNRRAHSQNAR